MGARDHPAWPLEGAGCDAARRLQERNGGPRLAGRARAQTRSFLWHAVYLPGAQGGPDNAPGLGRNRAGAGDEAPARWKVPLATPGRRGDERSEEHTSELQSLMRISYAVFCLKKKK